MSLDPVNLEKTLAKDFGGRDLLSKKRSLHLLREKVRRQNHERGSIYGFPCSHIIAACQFHYVDFRSFVQGYYCTDQLYYDTWATLFHPIFDEYEWPPYEGSTIMPSESMKRTSRGHPKSTRLHNEMDVREGKTTITIGFCKQPGHNLRSFRNRDQVD